MSPAADADPLHSGGSSHVGVNDLERPAALDPDDQYRLIQHLGNQCPQCWAAVGEVPHQHLYDVDHPLSRALLRSQGPPCCLVGLPSQHLKAVRDVRQRPLGFAELVVEEAYGTRSLPFLVWASELANKLFLQRPGLPGPVMCDLVARLELLTARHLLESAGRTVPKEAMLNLTSAQLHYLRGTRDKILRARILAEFASCQWKADLGRGGHTQQMRTEMQFALKQNLELVGSADPLLRFELAAAHLRRNAYFYPTRNSRGLHLLDEALRSVFAQAGDLPEPDRLHGLFKKADLASSINMVLYVKDQIGERLDSFGPLADDLQAALPELDALGAVRAEGWFSFWIGLLGSHGDALNWWLDALRRFASCGASAPYFAVSSSTPRLGNLIQDSERRDFLTSALRLAEESFDPEEAGIHNLRNTIGCS